MRQKRLARQANDYLDESRLLLEDMADGLEELRLKGQGVENLADRIVVVVFPFVSVVATNTLR
jgi:hypothetical protein